MNAHLDVRDLALQCFLDTVTDHVGIMHAHGAGNDQMELDEGDTSRVAGPQVMNKSLEIDPGGDGLTGWRRDRGGVPLSEVHRSIAVPRFGTNTRKFAAFLGPGYLVAVGYMDPGNWATSIAGGSRFGYTLLVVALVSNIMAIMLQSLCARLAIASGRDLAQAAATPILGPWPSASGSWPNSPSWPRTWRK
jgi:hypothetical protein